MNEARPENRVPRGCVITLWALLCLVVLPIIGLAYEIFIRPHPSWPVGRTEFDVAHEGAVARIDFRIVERRPYIFALQFNFREGPDFERVRRLVGDGSSTPGTAVPVQIKIVRLDGNPSTPVFNGLIQTSGEYSSVSIADQMPPYTAAFLREIIAVTLDPGKYRVEGTTTTDEPAFAATPSYLTIDFHPNK